MQPIGPFALILLAVAVGAHAQTPERCAQWIAKKGYARDYIEQRLGVRAPDIDRWANNIQPGEIEPGDVITIAAWPGHVAIVDDLERDAAGAIKRLKVSDYNARDGWQDRVCEVSAHFGKEQSRWLAPAAVNGQWRPPRPRRY